MLKIEINKYPLENAYKAKLTNDQWTFYRESIDYESLVFELKEAIRRMKP